jgi:lambda family phage portal protein
MTKTQSRIRSRWRKVSNSSDETVQIRTLDGPLTSTYSGSSVINTSLDFQGDFRSADSWMRYDLWRVRLRSRQLQRGNNMCRNFARTMCHFVLGARGFHMKVNALTMSSLGDPTDGQPDEVANTAIKNLMKKFGRSDNFETRKRLSRLAFDILVIWKLIFDGEVIIRKIRGFANDFNFAWQMIDPDYLDHNLNRIEPSGNITKMGVELDKDYKFPVAYWFLTRRPNDYFYNYATISQERYYRVPAEEIIHIYAQNDDSEQTRGWPWIFAGMLNLYRAEKFQEAALVNAQIGASKGFFYTKQYPEGWEGDPQDLDDDGSMIDRVSPGMATELPYGVDAKVIDTRYPDSELTPFLEAMALGMGLTFGTSYATTTGDLSKANFVSSKLGIEAENALFHSTQELLIEKWKIPGFDEELYRAILAGQVNLPIGKFEKFNQPIFTGHRRRGIQPLEEAKANETNINNRLTSISAIIEEQGLDRDEVFDQIQKDEEELKKRKIERILNVPSKVVIDPETEVPDNQPPPDPNQPPQKKKKGATNGAHGRFNRPALLPSPGGNSHR